MRITVGVTAHRDLVADEVTLLGERVRDFFEDLQARFPVLPLEVISPLAEGGDSLVAGIALDMGIPLTVVLPMPREAYLSDFGGAQARREFARLLDSAEHVIALPVRPGASLDEAPAREWQYAQLGVFISNHCQILLALWDGKENGPLGGTAQVVRYHLTAVMPGFEDEPPPASLLAENENDLAYHVVASRDRPGGQPANGLQVGQARWMTSHFSRPESDDIPPEYGLMLDRLSEFDQDCRRFSQAIEAEGERLLKDPPGAPMPPAAPLVDHLFSAADWLAVHFQKRVNRSLLAMYTLAAVMGLVFIVYSERAGSAWLLGAFLGLFFAGVALHLTGNSRQWHRKYLDYRALAEALRVQFYWNVSGVVDAHSPGFAYDTFLHKQDVELGWIRHVMRTASARRERGVEPAAEWLPWTIRQWIGEEESGTGQLTYYTNKARRNERTHRRTRRLGAVCLWAGIGLALVMLLGESMFTEPQRDIVMILMGTLPLIAGVREAMSSKKAEKELIKQYRFMGKVFTNARRLLDQSGDARFQRRVLRALGEAALEEGAEWILMRRERPIEHGGL